MGFKPNNSYALFQWSNNLNNGLSLRMPRIIIEESLWANLDQASKSVYVPLLKFVNKNGRAFPSLRTLAIVSGVTEKTAGKGIKGLDGLPGFNKIRWISSRGHIAYKYKIDEPPPDHKHTVWISHDYINGGNWSQLTPTAQAVLPVLKFFAFWEIEWYCELEDMEYELIEFTDIYKNRKYDFMDADESVVYEMAGISKRSLPEAYESLAQHYLIEPLESHEDGKVWKLFTKPFHCYKRDTLNDQVKERYR